MEGIRADEISKIIHCSVVPRIALFFYRRFAYEHNGDLVADRIDETAFRVYTFEPCRCFVDLDTRFALRTAQNF